MTIFFGLHVAFFAVAEPIYRAESGFSRASFIFEPDLRNGLLIQLHHHGDRVGLYTNYWCHLLKLFSVENLKSNREGIDHYERVKSPLTVARIW